eukprot:11465212-Ditylum_brightwellii.AAC.1
MALEKMRSLATGEPFVFLNFPVVLINIAVVEFVNCMACNVLNNDESIKHLYPSPTAQLSPPGPTY